VENDSRPGRTRTHVNKEERFIIETNQYIELRRIQMQLIYIRHAADDYDADTSHLHDTPLTAKGIRDATRTAVELVQRYGPPTMIYSSPYQRAVQTAHQMRTSLKLNVPIVLDGALGKYFPATYKGHVDVQDVTMAFRPPMRETKKQLRSRVIEHCQQMRHHLLLPQEKGGTVWCITHAIVVRRIAKIVFRQKKLTPKYLPSCAWTTAIPDIALLQRTHKAYYGASWFVGPTTTTTTTK
jgi:broad specificity phosphatase PhoE